MTETGLRRSVTTAAVTLVLTAAAVALVLFKFGPGGLIYAAARLLITTMTLSEFYAENRTATRCGAGNSRILLDSYLNRPPHLTMELLEAACSSDFVNDREEAAVYA